MNWRNKSFAIEFADNLSIQTSYLFQDEGGLFLYCSSEELEKEAREHFDNARDAFIDGVGHAAVAGITVEIPPVAIYEGYQSAKSFIKMGEEYTAGLDCKERAQRERDNRNNDLCDMRENDSTSFGDGLCDMRD